MAMVCLVFLYAGFPIYRTMVVFFLDNFLHNSSGLNFMVLFNLIGLELSSLIILM